MHVLLLCLLSGAVLQGGCLADGHMRSGDTVQGMTIYWKNVDANHICSAYNCSGAPLRENTGKSVYIKCSRCRSSEGGDGDGDADGFQSEDDDEETGAESSPPDGGSKGGSALDICNPIARENISKILPMQFLPLAYGTTHHYESKLGRGHVLAINPIQWQNNMPGDKYAISLAHCRAQRFAGDTSSSVTIYGAAFIVAPPKETKKKQKSNWLDVRVSRGNRNSTRARSGVRHDQWLRRKMNFFRQQWKLGPSQGMFAVTQADFKLTDSMPPDGYFDFSVACVNKRRIGPYQGCDFTGFTSCAMIGCVLHSDDELVNEAQREKFEKMATLGTKKYAEELAAANAKAEGESAAEAEKKAEAEEKAEAEKNAAAALAASQQSNQRPKYPQESPNVFGVPEPHDTDPQVHSVMQNYGDYLVGPEGLIAPPSPTMVDRLVAEKFRRGESTQEEDSAPLLYPQPGEVVPHDTINYPYSPHQHNQPYRPTPYPTAAMYPHFAQQPPQFGFPAAA